MTLDRDVRVDVQEKPAVPIAQSPEIPDLEGPALAIELHARHARWRLGKEFGRQIGLSLRIGPADQALVAHRPAMVASATGRDMGGETASHGRSALGITAEG